METAQHDAVPVRRQGLLTPYRVLDLTDARGLMAGQMLAKLGADVVQVEPVQGSGARRQGPFDDKAPRAEGSLYWAAYAAGKRGLACDLDRDEGRQLIRRLALAADFIFESDPPGAMASRGLDEASLRAINPALIHVSITPFGSHGPKARAAATDLTLWAAGGPLLQTRSAGGTPLRISVAQSWLHAAADAAGGALVAHFARLQNGQGQHVDISAQRSVMQCTLSSVLSAAVGHAHFSVGAPAQGKPAADLSGSGARTRRSKWQVRDGMIEMHLAMGPAGGRFTNSLMNYIHLEGGCGAELAAWDWSTLHLRIEAGEIGAADLESVRDVVARFLAGRSKRELMDAAVEHKLLLAPLMTMADQLESPQLRQRGFLAPVDAPSGRPMTLPGPCAHCSRPAFDTLRPAPRLGQHTDEVLGQWLELGAPQRDALRTAGVIR